MLHHHANCHDRARLGIRGETLTRSEAVVDTLVLSADGIDGRLLRGFPLSFLSTACRPWRYSTLVNKHGAKNHLPERVSAELLDVEKGKADVWHNLLLNNPGRSVRRNEHYTIGSTMNNSVSFWIMVMLAISCSTNAIGARRIIK